MNISPFFIASATSVFFGFYASLIGRLVIKHMRIRNVQVWHEEALLVIEKERGNACCRSLCRWRVFFWLTINAVFIYSVKVIDNLQIIQLWPNHFRFHHGCSGVLLLYPSQDYGKYFRELLWRAVEISPLYMLASRHLIGLEPHLLWDSSSWRQRVEKSI